MLVCMVLLGFLIGVVVVQVIGCMIGILNLIIFDMGGISLDVVLLLDGECCVVNEVVVYGYLLKVLMLDIYIVGVGGGLIVYVDNGGLLKVGLCSVGVNFGLVCYGFGNGEFIVIDVNVVLQIQNLEYLLNGCMKIDRSLLVVVIQMLVDWLGMEMLEIVNGIIDIVVVNMVKVIWVILVQCGYDLCDYMLVVFGGVGLVQVMWLVCELGMMCVLILCMLGVLCVFGLLMMDLCSDFFVISLIWLDEVMFDWVGEIFVDLVVCVDVWFDVEVIVGLVWVLNFSVDVCYVGQNYEIGVVLFEGLINVVSFDVICDGFLVVYCQFYGFVVEGELMQLVMFCVVVSGLV